jgi:hypothetical protein
MEELLADADAAVQLLLLAAAAVAGRRLIQLCTDAALNPALDD